MGAVLRHGRGTAAAVLSLAALFVLAFAGSGMAFGTLHGNSPFAR